MRSIAPRTGAPESTLAEDQPEYSPLTVCCYGDANGHTYVLSRWRPSREELARMVMGEDLYLALMTGGRPLQPICLQVGPEGWVVDDGAAAAAASDAEAPAAGPAPRRLGPSGLSAEDLAALVMMIQQGPADHRQIIGGAPLVTALLPSDEVVELYYDPAHPLHTLRFKLVRPDGRGAEAVLSYDALLAEPDLTLGWAIAVARAALERAAPDSTSPPADG